MSYYDKVKKELTDLLSDFRNSGVEFDEKFTELKQEKKRIERMENDVVLLAKERQMGFPWLAKAYEEYFKLQDRNIVDFLKYKSHPAVFGSEVVKEQTRLRRQAEKNRKIAEYLLEYYESIAPFLVDLKEEAGLGETDERELLKEYTKEELQDKVTNYLTKEEFRKLPSVERNQMALDRFWKRPKSKWLIGRLYERYIGQQYEEQGYDVDYVGIFKEFEDLGRDLICRNGDEFIVIQCKNWSQFKTIYEKHIFQFFGTVFQYKYENPNSKVRAIFCTSTSLSDLARRFAQELGIELQENVKMNINYPCIKCNVSRIDREKIYHLPFDQQYDRTKIEKNRGEFYCTTVKEAEEAGFRRAFRHRFES